MAISLHQHGRRGPKMGDRLRCLTLNELVATNELLTQGHTKVELHLSPGLLVN